MSKGLKLTLLTVAIALMGMYAMAKAPVVDEIPTVIIGGGTAGSTPPDVFVYPDALDLSTYVDDPDGTDAGIVWSYDVVGTAKYSFNGVDPLDGADPITPGALEINTQVLQGEVDTDTDPDTVTIRNIRLSPFSGTGETPDAPGAEFDSQVIALWASDGASATQGEVMIWTDNGGPDRLSMPEATGVEILNIDLTNNAPGWGANTLVVGGAITMSAGANGICVDVAAGGVNIGWYSSGYGFADLVDNAVYQIEMAVSGSQTTAGLSPLWDVIIDNLSDDGFTSGGNVYFYDALFLDNEGGANAATIGRTAFEVWFTPPSVNLASWRDSSTGAFSTANDPHNDMRFQFRVLDGDATSGYGGELDLGQICLGGVVGTRYDIGNVVEEAAVYNDAITDANVYQHALLGQTAFSFDAGGLTMGPSGSDWGTDISYVEPGDGDIFGGDPTDDYPIPWDTADQLYMLEVNMKAADAASAASPPDVIQIGMSVGTNELIQLNGITAGARGLNKIGTPQEASGTFVAFFYSHTPSLTASTDFKRIRPQIQVLNSSALSFEGQTTTTGDIVIESWSVKPVSFN